MNVQWSKQLSKYRKPIQIMLSGVVFYILAKYDIGLLYIFIAAVVLGGVLGKTFCKWMCPVGLIMEFMMSRMTEDQQKAQMYNYYKMGCPISWVQGFMNRFALFKIKKEDKTCVSCGLCDKACYITSLNKDFSVYKPNKKNAGEAFNCSKCLVCIDSCPKGSLQLKMGK